MKVALLGPIACVRRRVHYGPWELITSLLAEGLTARGIDVTLFATLDSVTKATLDGVSPTGYEESAEIDGRVWEALHVSHALSRSGEFDLVHNHLDWLPLAFSQHCAAPMLTTIHGFSGPSILPAYQRADSSYVAISDSDRSPAALHRDRPPRHRPVRAAGRPGPLDRFNSFWPNPSGQRHRYRHRDRPAGRSPADYLRHRPGPGLP